MEAHVRQNVLCDQVNARSKHSGDACHESIHSNIQMPYRFSSKVMHPALAHRRSHKGHNPKTYDHRREVEAMI